MKYMNAFRFFSILIVSSFLHTFDLVAQNNLSAEMEMKIDSVFEKFNDINKPGSTVAVVKDQEIVFKKRLQKC
jgi:hypothetical protein